MGTKASLFIDADLLTGAELIPIIQGGNRKATLNEIADFASASATVPDATLTVKGKIMLAGDLAGTADAPTVPGLADKLNIADYNPKFKGKYTSLSALETAYPTATAGDYAQVDAGTGSNVVNYNWDEEEGWVVGSAIGPAISTTDDLPEGSANLYFTTARAIAAVDISGKVDKITGKGLSTEDYSTLEKTKLSGIAAGAQVNDANTTLAGNEFNGNSQLVQLTAVGKYPALDGSLITNLPGGGTASGSDGQIQFNNSGALGADSLLAWDNINKRLGIGTIRPQGPLSVSPLRYATGTASQSGSVITGVGTTFTPSMVGSQFFFADGTYAGIITAVTNATSISSSIGGASVSSQAFRIVYTGLQVDATGNVGVGMEPSSTRELSVKGIISIRDKSNPGNAVGILLNPGNNLLPRPSITFSDTQNLQSIIMGTTGSFQGLETAGNFYVGGKLRTGSTFMLTSGIASTDSTSYTPGVGILLLGANNLGLGSDAFVAVNRIGTGNGFAFGYKNSDSNFHFYKTPTSPILLNGTLIYSIVQSTGNFLIGTSTDVASSLFTVAAATKGSIPAPRMTTTQRDAIPSPAEGLEIYNLTTHKKNVYTGSAWEQVTSV